MIPFFTPTGEKAIPEVCRIPFYVPKFFSASELVSRAFFAKFEKTPELIFGQFDPRILWTADAIREIFGPATINTWSSGGNLQWCGLRTAECKDGTALSQHRRGAALDLHPLNTTAEEIRTWIKANPNHPACRFITCLEIGVSWLHIDCRNHDREKSGILLVKP